MCASEPILPCNCPPYYQDATVTIHHGDCLDVLRSLPDASVDAVVTDPPYGLGFMGREWDALPPGVPFAAECLRVLKPGGHMLAFGGTRTWHRLACAVEDAGFEIRDSIAWMYGSGFPKSLDVSKAIDKANGKPLDRLREFGTYVRAARESSGLTQAEVNRAMQMPQGCGWWEGKGLGVKWDLHLPGVETWQRLKVVIPTLGAEWDWFIEWAEAEREVVGQSRHSADRSAVGWLGAMGKPEGERLVTSPATPDAERWQGWGTALKPAFEPIVVARKPLAGTVAANVLAHGTGALNVDGCRVAGDVPATQGGKTVDFVGGTIAGVRRDPFEPHAAGRWPANVILDESQAEVLDEQSGNVVGASSNGKRVGNGYGENFGAMEQAPSYADDGGASRFYYVAKADASERVRVDGIAHPTVKPLALMRWLVRLVTPPGGIVLEPFAGSGTTVEACILEGFRCIAIEREADYLPLIKQRIHRRRDPIAAIKSAGQDGGLFDLLGEGA